MTFGLRRTSSGVPSAIRSPWSRTVTRSLISMTTRMSCSMRRIVRPRSDRSRLIRPVSWSVSRGFMPAVGSSSSSSLGFEPRARAISRRRWSPYGRFLASWSSRALEADEREQLARPDPGRLLLACGPSGSRAARRSRSRLSFVCMPTSTFSIALMFWKRRMFWNVRPRPSTTMSFGRALLKMPSLDEEPLVDRRPRDADEHRHHQGDDRQQEPDDDRGFAPRLGTEDERDRGRRSPPAGPRGPARARPAWTVAMTFRPWNSISPAVGS